MRFSYSTINLSLGVKEKSSYKLALLSGLLPPTFYTVYENNNGCPLGLNCFKDFEKGLLESRYTNKPMLIDFTDGLVRIVEGWKKIPGQKMIFTI